MFGRLVAAESALPLNSERAELDPAEAQSMVADFTKRALSGYPCFIFKPRSGLRTTARYCIDRAVEHLIVLTGDDSTGFTQEVSCPLFSIQDIYSTQDGEACFPGQLHDQLVHGERDCLLMVVFSMGPFRLQRFCLIAESVESRNIFLVALRILCSSARMKPKSISTNATDLSGSTDDAGTVTVSSGSIEVGEAAVLDSPDKIKQTRDNGQSRVSVSSMMCEAGSTTMIPDMPECDGD